MSCPYLEKTDTYREDERFYCRLQNEYVDYNQYKTYCYSSWGTEYLSCPPYEHEDTRRRNNNQRPLKRN